MKHVHKIIQAVRCNKLYAAMIFAVLSVLYSSSLCASFLGPLALLSIPSTLSSFFTAKELNKVRDVIMQLSPHIILLLLVLAVVFTVVLIVFSISHIFKVYNFFCVQQYRSYLLLLNAIALEAALGVDLKKSENLKKVVTLHKRKFFRKKLGKSCYNLVEDTFEKLESKSLDTTDQISYINRLVAMITTLRNNV